MAGEYLDVISFRPRGDGKPFAHKIGSAKKNDKGGLNLYLDSLPLPDKDGRVSLLVAPPRESGGGGRTERRPPTTRPQTPRDDFEDDVVTF